jgi:hypothetical protein
MERNWIRDYLWSGKKIDSIWMNLISVKFLMAACAVRYMVRAYQKSFDTVLFDTLFGLILFFNIDLFIDIKDTYHLIWYLFSFFVVIHWWLEFKSADDAFGSEVDNSFVDIIFGIIYIIFIDYAILLARNYDYIGSSFFILAVIFMDFLWALVWKCFGKWSTKNKVRIKSMEDELTHTLWADSIGIFSIVLLFCLNVILVLSSVQFMIAMMVFYIIFVVLTFRLHIIDLKLY